MILLVFSYKQGSKPGGGQAQKAGQLRLADAPGVNPELCCLALGQYRPQEEKSHRQSSTRGEAITLNTTIIIVVILTAGAHPLL